MDDARDPYVSVRGLDRRAFLRGAAASLPLAYAAQGDLAISARAADPPTRPGDPPSPAGMIVRQTKPTNLEMPFSTLDDFLTPNDRFYVRTHFEVPDLKTTTWKLSVEGEVERPFELTYDALREMPSRTVTSILECSGNGRVFLEPPQVSIRWELGGVGNAEWTGVPLAAVLDRAGVKPNAVEVILEGTDRVEFTEPQSPTPGAIPYARSLPLTKAKAPEVLLAYEMNGQPLPPRHGHPVRAIVAGWYGMASVKWLRRIIVSATNPSTVTSRRWPTPSGSGGTGCPAWSP